MPNVKHTFVSAKANGPDATLVQPSNWNAEHFIEDFLDYPAIAPPVAPPSGLRTFASSLGGKTLPHYIAASGAASSIQTALFDGSTFL